MMVAAYGVAGCMVSASVPGLLATGALMSGAGAGPVVVVVDVPRLPLLVPVTLPVMGAVGTVGIVVVEKGALFLKADSALACAFKFICCAGETLAAPDPPGVLKFIRNDCCDDVSPPTRPGVAVVLPVVTPGPVRPVPPASPVESPPPMVDDGAPGTGPSLVPGTPTVPGVPTGPVPIPPMDVPAPPTAEPAPTAWGKAGEIPITNTPQKAADSAHLREVSMTVLTLASHNKTPNRVLLSQHSGIRPLAISDVGQYQCRARQAA